MIITQPTISSTLKKMKISQKSLRRIAAEREGELRCNYMVSLSHLASL